MTKYSQAVFIETLKSDPNPQLLQKNLKVFFSLFCFFTFTCLGILWAIWLDNKETKLKISPFGKLKYVKNSLNVEQRTVEDSLPSIFKRKPMLDRIFDEVKTHHKWFGIKFHFSKQFPRPLRVLSLLSSIIVLLFVQSLTNNLTNPDDGSCETFLTEESCLKPISTFGTGNSKCLWLSNMTCTFLKPANSTQIVVFVALLSALIGTPIVILINWIVHNVLCASSDPASLYDHSNLFTLSSKLKNSKKSFIYALKEMSELSAQILEYRNSLSQSERKEFDGIILIIFILIINCDLNHFY
jgi:hypothetical protein